MASETKEEAAARLQQEHEARQAAMGYDPRTEPARTAFQAAQQQRLSEGIKPGPKVFPPGVRAAQFGSPFAQVDGPAAELIRKLHPGEPIFIFRAQDILSVMVLSHYAMLLEQYGDLAMIEAVVDWRREFQQWQQANPGKVKLPD